VVQAENTGLSCSDWRICRLCSHIGGGSENLHYIDLNQLQRR
jgi:hypothetical protein